MASPVPGRCLWIFTLAFRASGKVPVDFHGGLPGAGKVLVDFHGGFPGAGKVTVGFHGGLPGSLSESLCVGPKKDDDTP